MIVRYWGTRGSIATISPDTQLYGGNTPCVSVAKDEHLLILDAGSGIHRLSQAKYYTDFDEIHIILSHLHMDHIQGLGFFEPFFSAESVVHIWGPPSAKHSLQARLSRYLSPPLFPFTINEFQCDLHIHEMHQEQFILGPFEIQTRYVCHPGPTLGIRIDTSTSTCTYIPDHELYLGSVNFPHNPTWTTGYDLAHNTDLLIHDAQYTEQEYNQRIGWGHSTISQAIAFAKIANAKKLRIFHHNPNHSDNQIDQIMTRFVNEKEIEIGVAKEGSTEELP